MNLSIIIPVYNAALFVGRMLDSLKVQTFTDFEVLMIDDGSTDESGKILDEYVAEDARFKVVHKPNEGVAMARQMGVNMAKGEYCIHADADDWVESTMLEELYIKAKAEDADIVIADYYINTIKNETFCKQKPDSFQPENILLDMFRTKLFGALWHKLVRTGLYSKYNARFFKGINHCEDLLIWTQLLQHPEVKISYIPRAFYHYCCNDSSITRNFTRSTYEMRMLFFEKLKDLLIVPEKEQILKKVLFGIFTEGFVYDVLTNEEIKRGIRLCSQQIADIKSLKWQMGFVLLRLGCNGLAHKFIHY